MRRENQGDTNRKGKTIMAKTRRDLWNSAAELAEKKAALNQEVCELTKELSDKLAAIGKLEEEQATILDELMATEPAAPDAAIPEDKPKDKEGDGGDGGGDEGDAGGDVREGEPPVPVAVVSAEDVSGEDKKDAAPDAEAAAPEEEGKGTAETAPAPADTPAAEGEGTGETPPAPASDADGGGGDTAADEADEESDGDEEAEGKEKKEEKPAAADAPEPPPVTAAPADQKSTADNQKPESD